MNQPQIARTNRLHGLAIAAMTGIAFAVPARAAVPASSAGPAPVVAAAIVTPAPLAANSIYQLPLSLTDQDGRTFRLDERRGHAMLVSMFYTSCQAVCPMLIDALRDTQKQLSAADRDRVGVLMVSFDPAHDTVAVLKSTADERGLDPAHWSVARTDPASVRKLAAMLGIQYRALANGEFNHTTALILVDAEGRIAARTSQLGHADAAFVKRIRVAAQADPR